MYRLVSILENLGANPGAFGRCAKRLSPGRLHSAFQAAATPVFTEDFGGRILGLANDAAPPYARTLAQRGDQRNAIHEVTGSNPVSSTNSDNNVREGAEGAEPRRVYYG